MNSGVYGTAEFRPGMEEVEDPIVTPTPTATPVSTPLPSVPAALATPVTSADSEDAVVHATDAGNEGLSLMQKALFLGGIFGAVAIYVRMNTRSPSRGVYSQV